MSVIENKATAIGDRIIIQSEIVINGLVGLTDYIDSVTGETATRLFKKTFRYSVNGGITWSDFIELTASNLQDIEVNVKDLFKIEYHYERIGTDDTGDLAFNNINLDGEFIYQQSGAQYNNSIFKEFFDVNDTRILAWAINVTNKLYGHGIVPEYFTRGETDNVREDEDYLNFWGTVAHFFALHVYYAREFQNFRSNPKLLLEYLRQRGLYICENEQIEDMIYLMENYHAEVAKRGTYQIIRKKSDGYAINGELLRLICFDEECDEFIFGYLENQYRGTCIGHSSPIYRGTKENPVVNKNFTTSYFGTGNNSYNASTDTYVIEPTDTTETGIETSEIIVDKNINYELVMNLSQDSLEDVINIELEGLNSSDGVVTFKSINDGSETTEMASGESLNIVNKDYFCRFLLYNSLQSQNNNTPNIGWGIHLQNRDSICKIKIKISTQGTSTLTIKDLKFRVSDTRYSTGFLNANNLIEIWMKNRNGEYNFDKIYSIIRRYLVNYNTSLLTTDLNNTDNKAQQSLEEIYGLDHELNFELQGY